MTTKLSRARPIRRVITGTDAHGRSIVVKGGPAANSYQFAYQSLPDRGWNESPARIEGNGDDAYALSFSVAPMMLGAIARTSRAVLAVASHGARISRVS